jgi:hypothetical protein
VSPVMRRVAVRGVIVSTSTFTADFVGTSKTPAATVQGQPLPSSVLPPAFKTNVPASVNIVTKGVDPLGAGFTSGSTFQVPVYVTSIYSLAANSRVFSILTVVSNPIRSPQSLADDIFVTAVVDVIGGGQGGNKNLDVLAGGPTFVPTGSPPPAAMVQSELVAPVREPDVQQTFGIGAAPYVTFIGRDNPGVSYTYFDVNRGQLIIQRAANDVTALIELRSDPTTDDPRTTAVHEADLTHLRFVAVGSRDDAASSTDLAVRALQHQLEASRGTPGAPVPANPILHTAVARGKIVNAPAGTIVEIAEHQPIFFSPVNPTSGASQAGFYGPTARPGVVGIPAGPLTSGARYNDVIRTTVRPDPDGEWTAIIPVGFDSADVALGAIPNVALGVTITSSVYSVRYLLPGASSQVNLDFSPVALTAGPVTVTAGEASVDFGTVDANDALAKLAYVDFEILDGTGGTHPVQRIPGKITVIPLGTSFGPLGLQLGSPTGLSEPMERASGAGNVVHSASGIGRIALPAGMAYKLVASAGTEWEAVTRTTTVLTPGVNTPLTGVNGFFLTQVVEPEDAISLDGHVHSGHSPDSAVPLDDRVRSFLAAHVQVLVGTDHDLVTDYGPAIAAVAAEQPAAPSLIHAVSGEEATTAVPWEAYPQSIGHWTAWPLPFGANVRKRGAPEDDFRPPAALIAELRALEGGQTSGIVGLAHPRSPRGAIVGGTALAGSPGFFENLTIPGRYQGVAGMDFTSPMNDDAVLGLLGGGTTGGPLPPQVAAVIAGSLSFDTIELMTGPTDPTRYVAVRGDWFHLLNLGIVKTAVGNTDTHRIDEKVFAAGGPPESVVGYPRNYLFIRGARPATITDAELVKALEPCFESQALPLREVAYLGGGRQRAFTTTGPFITTFTATVDGTTGTIGDLITASGTSDASFTITVDGPEFIMSQVNQAVIYVNGSPAAFVGLTQISATRLSATTGTLSILPAGRDCSIVLEVGKDVQTGTPGLVTPGSLYDLVSPKSMVVAITNPIFVDNDGTTGFNPAAPVP